MSMETEQLKTVRVVQVRTEELRTQLVVRRHGTREPWRRIWATVDGENGIDEVIRAADGDPEGDTEFAQWPFVTTRNTNTPGFHHDDVAVILIDANREDGGDSRDFHLLIADAFELWDVQVLTPLAVDITGYQTTALEAS